MQGRIHYLWKELRSCFDSRLTSDLEPVNCERGPLHVSKVDAYANEIGSIVRSAVLSCFAEQSAQASNSNVAVQLVMASSTARSSLCRSWRSCREYWSAESSLSHVANCQFKCCGT